jgi:hypothetical protein
MMRYEYERVGEGHQKARARWLSVRYFTIGTQQMPGKGFDPSHISPDLTIQA